MAWTNADGLLVRFSDEVGVRGAKAGVTTGAGKERELVMEVDLEGAARTIFSADANNDGTNESFSGLDTPIPANVKIEDVDIIVMEALAGGTSYSVGTYQEDGTVVDADGIFTDAGAAGAQIGTQSTQRLFVAVKTIGTYTAGKVKVIIRYLTV